MPFTIRPHPHDAPSRKNPAVLLVAKGFFHFLGLVFGFITIIIAYKEIGSWLSRGEWIGITLETVLNELRLLPVQNPHVWWNQPTEWIGVHRIVHGLAQIVLSAPLWVWSILLWIVVEDMAFKFDRELKLSRAMESREVGGKLPLKGKS